MDAPLTRSSPGQEKNDAPLTRSSPGQEKNDAPLTRSSPGPEEEDDMLGNYDDCYYSSRLGRDKWFIDHWGAAAGSKRERSARITELCPTRKKSRHQPCVKTRANMGASNNNNNSSSAIIIRLQADETLTDEEGEFVLSPPETPGVVVEEHNSNGSETVAVGVEEATAVGDSSGRFMAPKRGKFCRKEDKLLCEAVASLRSYAAPVGVKVPWTLICLAVPGRSSKQCRERFVEHLDPNLDLTQFSGQEADFVCHLFRTHGRKWSKICGELNRWRSSREYEGRRTGNLIKNFVLAKVHPLDDHHKDRPVVVVREPSEVAEEVAEEPVTTVHFFDELPSSPPRDTIGFEALSDVLPGLHVIDAAYDAEVEDMELEWGALIHEPSDDPIADSVADPVADTLPKTRRVVSGAHHYHERVVATPSRVCYHPPRRTVRVHLAAGDGWPRRALFKDINTMINKSHRVEPFRFPAPQLKRKVRTVQPKSRVATLSEAGKASTKKA